METDKFTFIKILHKTVESFISSVKCKFPPDVLATKKVFSEIVKRSESITQDLRNIACHIKTSLESSECFERDTLLNERVEKLVQNVLLQDFIELAFSAEDEIFSISDEELHNLLYYGSMRDITNFTPSSTELAGSFNFFPLASVSSCNISPYSPFDANFNSFILSAQFEKSRMQFDDELTELRRVSENGFLVSDLSKFNVATILKYENDDDISKTNTEQSNFKYVHCSPKLKKVITPSRSESPDSDLEIFTMISEYTGSFHSWEGCLGKFLSDHTYISEVNPEDAIQSISEKEHQTYYSLLNPKDAIPEEDMVHDILDLLIGVPSNTFYFDIHAHSFRIKRGVHLPNLSPECTAKVVANFVEAGSIFYALQKFTKDLVHSSEGLVFKGVQEGIHLILSMYKEYIVAVKVNRPTMLFLTSDVMKNAELLQSFGVICGINPEKMTFHDTPKGLGLLSYLHDIARSHRRKENGIMIAVLLKYAYAPYFRFLNEWMTEGNCNDPYEEFQIMEDINYLSRRDSLYWKFTFTENIDQSRAVPPEIKHYSQGILDCGKSIGLLKICCPELTSLKVLALKPPPSFTMVYSFPAAIHKLNECVRYIMFHQKASEMTSTSNVSADEYLITNQKCVDEKGMRKLFKRRYHLILAGIIGNCNVLNFKSVPDQIKIYQHSLSDLTANYDNFPRCECLPVSVSNKNILKGNVFRNIGPLFSPSLLNCITETPSNIENCKTFCIHLSGKIHDDNFSGKNYDRIGVLFSSCGYFENTAGSLSENVDLNFTTLDFNNQLQFTSSQVSHQLNEQCKQLFSSEVDYYSTFESSSNLEEVKNFGQDSACRGQLKGGVDKMKVSSSKKTTDIKRENLQARSSEKRFVPCSFMDKLVSLLISEYGDTIEDIYSCIQVTSLQRLMMHNFNAVLKMRIHIMEKMIMKYVVKQLGLDLLVASLRDIYFFQDETFNQSLCEPLFSLVMKSKTAKEFANWSVIKEILQNAVSNSSIGKSSFASSVFANIAHVSEKMAIERTDFLQLFIIEFEVKWPLNIIVHQACIQQYLRIFSVLLEIEFLCWLLGRVWRSLIMTSKRLHLDDAHQFRQIMLKRFDMDQFIRVVRNSIHQHLQGPLWEFLQKSLSAEESSIDALESVHMQYLEKALARCFLTDETHVLYQLLSTMSHQIYRFCNTVSKCSWEKNYSSGQYETFAFNGLSSAFDTYKEYQKIFLKRIMKETLTKKCGRYWDKDYQDFLETLCETERSNN